MKTKTSVLEAYGRRTLYTTLSLSVLLSSGPGAAFVALAQAPPAAQGTPNTGSRGQQGRNPRGGERLRIVPMPRKDGKTPAKPGDKPGNVIDPKKADPGRAAPPNPNAPKPEGPPINIPGNTPGAPGGGRQDTPGGGFSGRSGTPFSFEFRGADIINVLKFYAQMSGLNIITDPGLSGQVTILNPKPVTLDEAFKVLQAVLSVRGFGALQSGNNLTISPLDDQTRRTTNVGSYNEDGTPVLDLRNQVMTQVIPLDNVDAEALARELTPLISKGANLIGSPGTNSLIMTDTASNIQRFITLVDALDKTSNNSELMVYPLRFAEATAIADTINNLFRQTTTRGRGGGQPQQPGQPQMMPQPGQPGQPGAGGGGRPAVIATADVRTNQVLVVASPANQQQIARDIINRLDDDGSNTLDTIPRKIKYSDAVQIASQVNQILSGMRLGGSTGQGSNPSFQQRTFGNFGGFFGGGFGGGNNQQSGEVTPSTDPFGKVTADARTNTIFITASAEKMRKINELVDLLDVDVPVETTTFVIPLKNAQASDVAYALGQAFSTSGQNNNNGFGGIFFGGFGGNQNQRGNQRQPINRRLSSQNNNNPFGGRSARGRSVPPGPPNAPGGDYDDGTTGSAIPDGVPGVMTKDGFVPTDVPVQDERTRQFFFGGRQQNRLGQNTGPQYGPGRTGTFSNLLQLQNNVFVTPSPYGDSLILTTTPENYKAITDLIAQLDVVQPQVMIEVIIAEVTLDKNEKLGFSIAGRLANLFGKTNTSNIRINLPSPGSGTTFDAAAGGFQGTLSGANYDGLIQALNTDSKVKVLSTPRVFTTNNQQAVIEIVTEIPFVTGQNITAGVNGNILTNVTDTRNVGFTLTVTPRIARQGLVTIDVASETSDLLRFDTLGTGDAALRLPVVNTRYTDTSVTVMDSETVVIGGLIRESSTLNLQKVPILSEIPLIGQFFRSREKVNNRVELMVFMTPRVVRSVEEARELTRRQGNLIMPNMPNLKKIEPNLDPDQKKQGTNTLRTNGQQKPPTDNQQKPPDNKQQPPPDTGQQPPPTGTGGTG